MPRRRRLAAAALALVLVALVVVGSWPAGPPGVPDGAGAGSLDLEPCTYATEAGELAADCGTLVVPENRRDPASELIALPVTRIRSASPTPAEPVFRLGGGPGLTNTNFPQASRLTAAHDVVLVGYRGVDGSRDLDCPEVTAVLGSSDDMTGPSSLPRTRAAFQLCADRLTGDGVDLTSYGVADRVDDVEAARTALGYDRINLLSSSAGTRTAMVYSWRHPASLNRSAMLSVNPPGHLFWDPEITDSQFGQYAELCRAEPSCASPDLAASVREVATDIPERWGPLAIKDTNVRILSQYAMHHNGPGSAPNNAPTVLDAYLDGGPAALWAMSVLGDVALPGSIVWGEFASFAMIDAPVVEQYYADGGDPGSILGNSSTDFLWGGPSGLATVWPSATADAEYRDLRPSDVETLVVSGELDFSTPAQNATDELMPTLSRGQQVILPGLGHTNDIWEHRPGASQHLLTTFFATGQVDASQFDRRPVDFAAVPLGMATIAWLLVGVTTVGAALGLLLLGVLARVRTRRASVRIATVLPLGLAGWFLGVLVTWTVAPGDAVTSATVVVPGAGLLIGLGAHLTTSRTTSWTAPVGAVAGGLLGGWLGSTAAAGLLSPPFAILGAAVGAHLVLLLITPLHDRAPAA